MAPERLHLTEIIVGRAGAGAVAERLKHESFHTVAKSIRADEATGTGYYDIGWITRDQLEAADRSPLARLMVKERAERAAAASLKVGGTARVDAGDNQEFVHLEEIRAKMSCDRAVARYPKDLDALNARAAFLSQAGNRRAAIADYSAIIRLDPGSYEGHYGRAFAYYAAGEYQRALDDVEAARAAKSSGDTYMLLGLIEEARGDDDLATADEAYAIAQYQGWGNDDSQARYALGVAYENLGYFGAAIDEFNATLKKRPNTASVYMSRALAWFASGDLTKARNDFVAASHADAKVASPYLGLALLSFSKGDAAAALGYARAALRADPHDAYAALLVLVSDRTLHRAAQPVQWEAFANAPGWPAAVIRVYLDRAPAGSLEAAASSPDAFTQQRHRCEARFYGAVYALAAGDRVQAVPLLRQAVRECPYREYERAAADQMLRSTLADRARVPRESR